MRAHLGELATYATAMAGLLVLIGVIAYRYRITNNGALFEQARYLLPLLALYAGVIGLAVRAAGSRLGPAVGAFVVVLAAGHSLFAQFLAIARFYL